MAFVALVVPVLAGAGCAINYQRHHHTRILRLYHNAAHPPHGLGPRWAEMALRVVAGDLGVPLDRITPVDVYIDCDPASRSPSRFNRLTKSIVLRVGQADLHRLYIHEITHLVVDHIDGSPPYWADQGLAEYMESRCSASRADAASLLPPSIDAGAADTVARIGRSTPRDVLVHLSERAIDGGWSWTTPFIHYLLEYRWEAEPFARRVRSLLDLDLDGVALLARPFIEFCASFDPVADFLRQYRRSSREIRLALLGEVHWRFSLRRIEVFDRLLEVEEDPDLLRLVASGKLIASPPGATGEVFDEVAGVLHPDPLPDLDAAQSLALAGHLIRGERISPEDWRFPMVASFLATRTPPSLLPLDLVLSWLSRWPDRAAAFASRADVKADLAPRLATLRPPLLAVMLGTLELVQPGDASRVPGPAGEDDYRLEGWAGRISLLTAAEKAALRDRLAAVVGARASAAPGDAARARAAALLLYLGGAPREGLVEAVSLPGAPPDVSIFAARYISR